MKTQTEALKLALEALKKARRKVLTTEECHAVIMSIKEALAQPERPQNCGTGYCSCIECVMEPEQEPKAWMFPDALCDKACLYLCTKGFTQFPECATTPPQPEHEPVWGGGPTNKDYEDAMRLKRLNQIATPPQRTWFGLTDEEVLGVFGKFTAMTGKSWLDLYRMAEAKLKEKNNG